MKNLILLFSILISVLSFSQDQFQSNNYRIIYDFSFQTDSTDINSNKSEKMVLFCNDTLSLFRSYVDYQRDSIIYEDEKNGISAFEALNKLSSYPKAKISLRLEKLLNKDSFRITKKVFSDFYEYEEKSDINWNLRNDTINYISGYKCKMALTHLDGRDYIAWYTEDIPIFDGPYKFHGLPGLIISVHDSKMFFSFQINELKKVEKFYFPDLSSNKKVIKVTKKEYKKAKKNFDKNALNRLREKGVTFKNEEEVKRILMKKNKRNNNPIELTDE